MSYAVVFGPSGSGGAAAAPVTKKCSKKKTKPTAAVPAAATSDNGVVAETTLTAAASDGQTTSTAAAATATAAAGSSGVPAEQDGTSKPKSRAPRKRGTRKKQPALNGALDAQNAAIGSAGEGSDDGAAKNVRSAKHLWMVMSGMRDVQQAMGPSAPVASIGRLCELMWKNLSQFEKDKWVANVDAMRLTSALVGSGNTQTHGAAGTAAQSGGKGKRQRGGGRKARASGNVEISDVPAAKKPKQNAYMSWVKHEGRAAVRKMFPEMGSSAIESAKRCGELWRAMSAEEKAKWANVDEQNLTGPTSAAINNLVSAASEPVAMTTADAANTQTSKGEMHDHDDALTTN